MTLKINKVWRTPRGEIGVSEGDANWLGIELRDDGSFGRISFEDDASAGEYAKSVKAHVAEAWPRYLAEKAKRSWPIGTAAATMRPVSDLPDHVSRSVEAIFTLRGGEKHYTPSLFSADGHTIGLYGHPQVIDGWWPLPDLTPMPAEFDGWDA